MYERTVLMNRVNFAAELARSGLKIADVAELAGIRAETVSRARRGCKIRVSTVENLAGVFDIPSAMLMEEMEGC